MTGVGVSHSGWWYGSNGYGSLGREFAVKTVSPVTRYVFVIVRGHPGCIPGFLCRYGTCG